MRYITPNNLERNRIPVSPEDRQLLYFPIVHTQADMGALADSVREISLQKMGRERWQQKIKLIDKFWDEIEKYLESLSVSWQNCRIYQDGLPVCDKELLIVRELAKSGSRNHILVMKLVDKGAKLMGTESLELLLEEYENVKKLLAGAGASRRKKSDKDFDTSLLERRDQFIARRVNDTLRPGEVGIIFLGMLHRLQPWMPKDIRISYPVGRPSDG
jgi:hypothetical protein